MPHQHIIRIFLSFSRLLSRKVLRRHRFARGERWTETTTIMVIITTYLDTRETGFGYLILFLFFPYIPSSFFTPLSKCIQKCMAEIYEVLPIFQPVLPLHVSHLMLRWRFDLKEFHCLSNLAVMPVCLPSFSFVTANVLGKV